MVVDPPQIVVLPVMDAVMLAPTLTVILEVAVQVPAVTITE